MGETGEGIRPTKSAEIKPDFHIAELLRGAEKKASTESFKNRMRSWPEVKGVDSIKRASGMAVDKVGELFGNGVVDEMAKLGVRVDLGKFSVSARPEDDEAKINFWKKIDQFRHPPQVITVRVGPEEFEQRGAVDLSVSYRRELEKMLNKPEGRKEVWAAVENLSNLTPRGIARAFRKSIEDGQDVIRKRQKREPKEELKALRRGNQ